MSRSSTSRDCSQRVVVADDADVHAGAGAGHAAGRQAGVFQGLPGYFQQQAVLGVDAHRFPRRDAEEVGVELVDAVEEPAPAGVHLPGGRRVGVVEVVDVPTVGRDLAQRFRTATEQMPESGRIAAAGEAAAHAHHGDGFHCARSRAASLACVCFTRRTAFCNGVSCSVAIPTLVRATFGRKRTSGPSCQSGPTAHRPCGITPIIVPPRRLNPGRGSGPTLPPCNCTSPTHGRAKRGPSFRAKKGREFRRAARPSPAVPAPRRALETHVLDGRGLGPRCYGRR